MNTITDAVTFRKVESNLFPKKSGMVFASSFCVMILVRLPRMFQARREPIKALPRPAQVAERP